MAASTTMPFDDNAYRKEHLKPLLDAGSLDFHDAFAIFGLDPAIDDDAAIRTQVDQVIVFWRREQSRSPRYKPLVTALLAQQKELSATVLDRTRRAALRHQVLGERAVAEGARFSQLEKMAAGIVPRYGGIPKSRVDRLRVAGKRLGVTDPEFDAWIGRYRVVDDEASRVEPLPASVRNQIRKLLDELHMLEVTAGTATARSRAHRSLFDVLAVPVDAPTATIEAQRAAMAARNRQREHNRLRTVLDELLAFTTSCLVEGDRARYLAGLVADVADRLRPEVETAILVDDRVTAPEFERLVRTAVAQGLSAEEARTAISGLARELGGAVETGAAVDYVTCPSCGAAEVADRSRRRCRNCQTELYVKCPQCATEIEGSAMVCPSCSFNLRQLADVRADLERARALRAGGKLAEARQVAAAALSWRALEPTVDQVIAEMESAWRVAIEQRTSLRSAVAEGRFSDAAHLVEVLTRTAADVTEPGAPSLDDLRHQAAEGLAAVRARLEAAEAMAGVEQEHALLALLADAPDSSEALARLRSIPVAAPSRLLAVVGSSSVRVTWRASRSPGPLDYRVSREATAPDGTREPLRAWTTDATTFEDGGCRTGSIVTYGVRARRHGIESGEGRTGSVLVAREVDGLTAIDHDGSVDIRWRHPPGVGEVRIERTRTDRPDEPTRQLAAGLGGLIDTSVTNGGTYRYRVYVVYGTPQAPVPTEGRFVTGQPFALPEPLQGLKAEAGAEQIVLTWPAPETGTVAVVRVMAGTTPTAGEIVDPRHLERLGEVLPADGDGAADRTGGGVRWYVPVTVVGRQAVVGEPVRHTGLGDVTDLVAADDGDDIRLQWTWPQGCTEALVVWSRTRLPSGAADPGTERAKVTNMAYELKHGWRLPKAESGTYHFEVLPGARDGSAVVWSAPGPRSGITHERPRRRGPRGR